MPDAEPTGGQDISASGNQTQKRGFLKTIGKKSSKAGTKVEKSGNARKDTLMGHLLALRRVFIVSVVAVLVGFLVAFLVFSEQMLLFFTQPLHDRELEIIATGLQETFLVQMKTSLIAGIVVASPVVFWQIWSFLKPALYPKERAKFRLVFFVILLLFISGILFAYLLVFGIMVDFFIYTSENLTTPMISIQEFINLLFRFLVPFGLVFQIPVVIVLLCKVGIVTPKKLSKVRKYIVFASFVLAAVLTPPDVLSQIMLAVPMIILFEAGLLVSRINAKRKRKLEDAAEEAS